MDKAEPLASGLREKGHDVHALSLDLANHDSILKLKSEIAEKFGKLDVLVNCSVAHPMKGYNAPLSELRESMEINAIGLMDITRELIELMAQGEGGTIVNIASMMGMFGPDLSNYEGLPPEWSDLPPDYFFNKGGMINWTKYLARMLADKKIRANSISPGGIFSNQPEEFLKNYTKKVPVGRMANNDDIKGLVVFLASQASAYINGENILMDGGMHA